MAARRYPIEVIISGVDRVTAPIRRINERINRSFAPLRRLSGALGALSREAGVLRLSESMGNLYHRTVDVAGQMRGLTLRVAALAGISSLASKGLFGLATTTAQAGDEAAKTALRLGVSAEWLQEMRYAAQSAGIGAETFDMAMQRAGRRIGEFAATGKSTAGPAIKALGLQIYDANGRLRTMEDMLPEIADKLARIRSPLVRNALAMKLFDSEGVKLVQMLENGAASLEAMRARARELGVVLSRDTVRSAEEFNSVWDDMKAALLGVRYTIGVALMPVVRDLAERLTSFLVENRDAIAEWAREFARSLPTFDQIRGFVASLTDALRPLVDAFRWLSDRIGTTNAALLLLGLYLGSGLIGSVIALSGAIVQVGWAAARVLIPAVTALIPVLVKLGAAFLATPFGLVTAAIAGLVAAGVLLVRNWDGVSAWWSGIWAGITDRVESAVEWFTSGIGGLLAPGLLLIRNWGKISAQWSGIWDGITDRVERAVGWISRRVSAMRSILPTWLGGTDESEAQPDLARETTLRRPDPELARSTTLLRPERVLSPADTQAATRSEAHVVVDFRNLPPGTRVEADRRSTADLDLSMGYSMLPGGA